MEHYDLKNILDYLDTIKDVLKSNCILLSRGGSDDYNDGMEAIRNIESILNKYKEKDSEQN